MYKVITHSIREEHFDAPSTAAFGLATYCNTQPVANTVEGNSTPTISSMVPGMTICMRDGFEPKKSKADLSISKILVDDYNDDYWNDYGFFDAYGDLYLHGDLYLDGDLIMYGTLSGRGTISKVPKLDANPKANSWPGKAGDIARTSSHIYLCVEDDKWIRWAIQESW